LAEGTIERLTEIHKEDDLEELFFQLISKSESEATQRDAVAQQV